MKISIIIPNYNGATFIKETIESVLNQSYNDWEVLIVDDGSTDNSYGIAQPFISERIKWFERPTDLPKGGNSCRNYGINNAQGEYVIFLDSDDLLAQYCLEQRVSYLTRNPNLDFAVFHLYNFRGSIEHKQIFTKLDVENPLEHFLGYHCIWQTMAPIWKLDFLKSMDGFNINYQRLQDPEMVTRALSIKGVKFHLVNESKPDAYYRILSNNNPNKGQKLFVALMQYASFFYTIERFPNISHKSLWAMFVNLSFFCYMYADKKQMLDYQNTIMLLEKYDDRIKKNLIYKACINRLWIKVNRFNLLKRMWGRLYSIYINRYWK